MRVLVTGAAGFIGAHVVRQLVQQGDQVTALVRPGGDTGRLADVAASVSSVAADLEDRATIERVLAAHVPEAVIHLAWHARPEDYLSSSRNLDSLSATLALVRSAVGVRCPRFVGVGTCLEYADLPRARREDDVLDPLSLYAASKVSAWFAARALTRDTETSLAWGRLFQLHGPGEHPARIVPRVAAALRARQPIKLSPGTQLRDQLRVEDMAAGLIALARSSERGAFNVCSGQMHPLKEVLTVLGELLGGADLLRFGEYPAAPGEPACLGGEAQRLRSLGWRPTFGSLRESLAYLAAPAVQSATR